MKLILEGQFRRLVLDLSVQHHECAEDDEPHPQGSESMVENAAVPERPQFGFCPPSDPIRKHEEWDD